MTPKAASAVDGASGVLTFAEAQETNGTLAEAKTRVPQLPVEPVIGVIKLINPVLRGWPNYFGREEGSAPCSNPENARLDAME